MKTVKYFLNHTINIVSQSHKVTNQKDLVFFSDFIKDIPNCKMIDIGANKGYYALLSTIKKDLFYSSYEPLKNVYNNYLNKNIQLNNAQSNGKTFNFGFSNVEGDFELWFDNTENATLSKDLDKAQEVIDKKAKYPNREKFFIYKSQMAHFKVLDDYMKDKTIEDLFGVQLDNDKIDVVKLDVEGAEDLVIDGGLSFLKKHKPILFLETEDRHCKRFNTTVDARLKRIKETFGYENIIKVNDNHICY